MQLTLINQAAGTRSYLGGLVTVAQDSSTTISRELNVIISQDAQFIFDCTSEVIRLNNGATDLSGPSALILIQTLSNFATDPLATLFLYYSAPIDIRQSTTSAVGTTVWTLRNPAASPYQYVIQSIFLKMTFDGATPLGAQSLRYDVCRFSTATPSGGTAITPIRYSTLAPASGGDCRFSDTGLTTTSVVFENPFDSIIVPAVKGSVVDHADNFAFIKLAPGEGVAIRIADNAAIVGQGLSGKIVWSHR